jgi:Zn ribbon nucleic-acid-binding protein
MVRKKDPFRPAECHTDCPKCGWTLAWNKEDRLREQTCAACSYQFTGHERRSRSKGQAWQSSTSNGQ